LRFRRLSAACDGVFHLFLQIVDEEIQMQHLLLLFLVSRPNRSFCKQNFVEKATGYCLRRGINS